MKRVLAISFLFVFLIAYIIPVTSVYATEVTWGDNNSYYLTDEEFYTSRQLATLEIIPQLTGNGVNELNINNAENVDDWIVNFLEFIDDNAESAVSDIYSTCVDIKNEIDNTANRIGQELKSFGTNLDYAFDEIDDWIDNVLGIKSTYLTNPNFVKDFNRLSRISTPEPTPNPDPDFTFLENQKKLLFWNSNGVNYGFGTNYIDFVQYGNTFTSITNGYDNRQTSPNYNTLYVSYYCPSGAIHTNQNVNNYVVYPLSNILRIDFSTTTYNAVYSGATFQTDYLNGYSGYNNTNIQLANLGAYPNQLFWNYRSFNTSYPQFRTDFDSLSVAINYFYNYFANFTLYVDGELWTQGGQSTNNISLNINGIDFYSDTNDQPIQYYYPQGTNIDYKKLYLVIKQAIEDSLPITQTTINNGDVFYDNSNNVYSPIIYNYYNNDNENENDVISDVLTLAVIPKFDTALLQPIEEPITNGTVIMVTGVQALPSDILFVIGAGFVLILFGAFINRLIE